MNTLRRRRGLAIALLLVLMATTSFGAWAFWTAVVSSGSTGGAQAGSVDAGNKPTATLLTGTTDVKVEWTASKLANDAGVDGYVVRRYAENGSMAATVGANCDVTISGLTCTETSVPTGSWQYTVTPKFKNWTGAESPRSEKITVAPTDTQPPVLTVTLVNGASRTFPYHTSSDIATMHGACTQGDGPVTVTVSGSASRSTSGGSCSSGQWQVNFSPALGEGSYAVAATQTDAAGNTGTTGEKTLVVDKTAPFISKAEIFDANHDGIAETVEVTMNEPLGSAGNATGSWEVDSSPTGSSALAAAPALNGNVVTLQLLGTTVNTAVSGTTDVNVLSNGGVRDRAGNAATLAEVLIADKAKPVPTALVDDDPQASGGQEPNNGLFQSGDHLTITFSEPMAVPAITSVTVDLVGGVGSASDKLTVTDLLQGIAPLGSGGYITGDHASARWAASALSRHGGGNNQIRLTLSNTCTSVTSGACNALAKQATEASFVLDPDGKNIKDQAGNGAAQSSTNPSFGIRLF